MSQNKYAKIAVPLPVEGVFDYLVPQELRADIKIGQRVWIAFGRSKKIIGYVTGLCASSAIQGQKIKIKEIISVIDQEPILGADIIELCKWVGEYYFCSWGEALSAAVPGGLKKGKVKMTSRITEGLGQGVVLGTKLVPNAGQKQALDKITASINNSEFQVFLLHGITSSGKTEVYLQAIDHVLGQGKTAIYLVPEISLTPQAVERFKSRFGDQVSILHSHLTAGQRYQQWENIKTGQSKIVVGARSAIFAPVRDLGLVIVDEEHENSYKQEDVPRYHARDTGIMRAAQGKAVVVLGSATPSLESFCNVNKGKYSLLELKTRIDNRLLPEVAIVDMRKEIFGKKQTVLSRRLEEQIQQCLQRKEQVILFLNRRGFSTYCLCCKCGYVAECPHCSVTLTYHSHNQELICHYCNYRTLPQTICPECQSQYIGYLGLGTQKVESELNRCFPHSRIERMDTDSVSKRGAHESILKSFQKGEIDIIIGTQMIAKGLDFPNVTLVGVINADVTLNFPDFRAAERTFQLLTQVAGRSGRGPVPGRVIIQTYSPDNYAVLASSQHDYNSFIKQELIFRKQLSYPPYLNLINIVIRSKHENKVIKAIEKLNRRIKELFQQPNLPRFSIMGPAPMPLAKLRGMFRWGLTIKTPDITRTNVLLKKIVTKDITPSGVKIKIDIDPQVMM